MSETTRKRLPFRWLTLGEIVGVMAVVIAALGLLENHREHVEAAREHAAEAQAGALKDTFLMVGALDRDGGALRLSSVHPDQVIQTQTGNPRLEAGWIEDGVRKAASKTNAGKAKQGRVPVGVTTVYIEDGDTKTDNAVYELAYSLHPRFLQGDRVALEGLSLARRGVTGSVQSAVDQAWTGK